MIEERPDVDFFAHTACDGCNCACGPPCTVDACAGLLGGCTRLLNGCAGLLDRCAGLGVAENTRHLAEAQRALDPRRGHGWSSL